MPRPWSGTPDTEEQGGLKVPRALLNCSLGVLTLTQVKAAAAQVGDLN